MFQTRQTPKKVRDSWKKNGYTVVVTIYYIKPDPLTYRAQVTLNIYSEQKKDELISWTRHEYNDSDELFGIKPGGILYHDKVSDPNLTLIYGSCEIRLL